MFDSSSTLDYPISTICPDGKIDRNHSIRQAPVSGGLSFMPSRSHYSRFDRIGCSCIIFRT